MISSKIPSFHENDEIILFLRLTVYQKLYGANKTEHFSVENEDWRYWKNAEVQMTGFSTNFEMYIEVVLGKTYGNIAIDDVILYEGDCSNAPTIPTPEKGNQGNEVKTT